MAYSRAVAGRGAAAGWDVHEGTMKYWSPGDTVVLRFVGHDNGWMIGAPNIVVDDGEDGVTLFQPPSTRLVNFRFQEQDERSRLDPASARSWPVEYVMPPGILRLMPTGAAHAVELYFREGLPNSPLVTESSMDSSGWWRGWKINLQAPFRRTLIGFDVTDNTLDIVAPRDVRLWRWKDEEQVAHRVAVGLTTPWEAAAFRAEGERIAANMEAGVFPFDRDWSGWRPDPAWVAPVLPDGWEYFEGYDWDLNRVRPIDESPSRHAG